MSFISAPSSSAPSAIGPVAAFLEGLGFSAEASRMLIPLALALLVIAGSEILRRAKFRRRRSNGFAGRSAQRDTGPRLVHGDDHMRLVAGAEFERTPLLNRSEARILPILAEEMAAAGYEVPRAPRLPSRDDAVRQFQMATALKRDRNRAADEG
ncbi:MAG: hypothetical protein IE919_19400 [Thioclava sp.]|nr:hypothetical protein [Thioclava sp.]MBD3805374.1 hypothetical protein [Thioclava sp.]